MLVQPLAWHAVSPASNLAPCRHGAPWELVPAETPRGTLSWPWDKGICVPARTQHGNPQSTMANMLSVIISLASVEDVEDGGAQMSQPRQVGMGVRWTRAREQAKRILGCAGTHILGSPGTHVLLCPGIHVPGWQGPTSGGAHAGGFASPALDMAGGQSHCCTNCASPGTSDTREDVSGEIVPAH